MNSRYNLYSAASLLICVICLGCDKGPDNVFSIPSPTNGQAPPAATEEVIVTDPNNPFVPTVESTQGHWQMTAGTINGGGFPASMVNTTTLQLNGENYEVMSGGNPDKGTCVLDLATTPFKMTINGVEGANEGKKILAIFEMPNEKTLKVCYDLTGTDFPKDFESNKENGYFSTVYTRKP